MVVYQIDGHYIIDAMRNDEKKTREVVAFAQSEIRRMCGKAYNSAERRYTKKGINETFDAYTAEILRLYDEKLDGIEVSCPDGSSGKDAVKAEIERVRRNVLFDHRMNLISALTSMVVSVVASVLANLYLVPKLLPYFQK